MLAKMLDRELTVSWRERAFAVASLACGVVFVVLVVLFAVNSLGYLLVALVGLALTVGGVWWLVTERMPRRAVGIAAAVVGVIGIFVTVVQVTTQSEHPVL
jgi:di/tricarboxylate transporter